MSWEMALCRVAARRRMPGRRDRHFTIHPNIMASLKGESVLCDMFHCAERFHLFFSNSGHLSSLQIYFHSPPFVLTRFEHVVFSPFH
jgi:hypothetical protein